jgi:hypothetical protein
MDGWLTRPGGSPFRCDTTVAHQVVACGETSSLIADHGRGVGGRSHGRERVASKRCVRQEALALQNEVTGGVNV